MRYAYIARETSYSAIAKHMYFIILLGNHPQKTEVDNKRMSCNHDCSFYIEQEHMDETNYANIMKIRILKRCGLYSKHIKRKIFTICDVC